MDDLTGKELVIKTQTIILYWLYSLLFLVIVMVVVGGLTRLTDSGLSIPEWSLIKGIIPPLDFADWEREFEKYKLIPEFRIQNAKMSLSEFKIIYWWEWGHRFLGRIIGIVWIIGFVTFLWKKSFLAGWHKRALLVGSLIGIQGGLGWWMVSSGLAEEKVDVSNIRLSMHLGTAFIIIGLISRYIFLLRYWQNELFVLKKNRKTKLLYLSTGMIYICFLQILLGAIVAGIDGGTAYTDWPLMGGEVLPSDAFNLKQSGQNLFENQAFTQFLHRITGYIFLLCFFYFWLLTRSVENLYLRNSANWLMFAIFLQVVLGIITLINASPWQLAILHQLGAVFVWWGVIRVQFKCSYPCLKLARNKHQ